MPLYFAYGSNMDVAAMARRCPASKPLGLARLARHRFFITAPGYASVARDPVRMVHGVLWELALSDVPALDAYEEVARGLFHKAIQPVLTAGGAKRALVYIGAQTQAGPPLPGYMEGVLAAARHWKLPAAYLREISAFAPAGGRTPVLDAAPTKAAPAVRPRFATPFDRR
jgi:AIG2-like family